MFNLDKETMQIFRLMHGSTTDDKNLRASYEGSPCWCNIKSLLISIYNEGYKTAEKLYSCELD
jgi:hypothetical protein